MGFSPALVQAAFDETGPAGTRQDAMDWLLDNASNYSPPAGLGKGIELIVANDELDKIRKQDARKKSARLAEGATDTKETLRVEVKSGWLHKHNRLGWGQRWFVLDYAPSDNSLRMRYWHSRPGKYEDIEKGEEKGTKMLGLASTETVKIVHGGNNTAAEVGEAAGRQFVFRIGPPVRLLISRVPFTVYVTCCFVTTLRAATPFSCYQHHPGWISTTGWKNSNPRTGVLMMGRFRE